MDLDWKRIKNQNIYDALYISDSSESENEELIINPPKQKTKLPYLCDNMINKKICRKSFKNTYNNYTNPIIDKNILLLEKSINKLCINIRTDDKLFTPNKKPRNLGCGIYE